MTLTQLDPTGIDRAELIAFMTGNEFPFHMRRRPTAAQVEATINDGGFDDEETKTYWIDHVDLGRVGIISFEDLGDPTPLFDLRLSSEFRGRNLGTLILQAATDHVFTTMEAIRFEGQTREDNFAMRTVFHRCGWVKEAYYRDGWPVEGGSPVASVGYAILRRDWEQGTTTPVPWNDFTPPPK